MVATVGGPAVHRERASEPVGGRAQQRPIQLDARPEPLGPVRGIALAVTLGVAAWVLIVAIFLRF
jgi:hypothetical protein